MADTGSSSETGHVCVVGAGLAGTAAALLLSKLGFKVSIFEKRPDPLLDLHSSNSHSDAASIAAFGASTSASKRSINLALSTRGMVTLQEIGILDQVMSNAIRMPARIIHNLNGSEVLQAYGRDDQAIWSVGRETINTLLLQQIKADQRITITFNSTLLDAHPDGSVIFKLADGSEQGYTFDLVIGSDGAYSAVRESMLRRGRIDFQRHYISHGYKELSIPPKIKKHTGNSLPGADNDNELEYALESVHGLHIWPRGDFMLIALPNPDKSFTATLFAPYHGADGFDAVDPNDAQQVQAHFNKHFPDVVPLMPDLPEDYRTNPVGSLVTVRVKPWNLGKLLLLGDAAHAVVPFFGQGMNAGFQDSYLLYTIIKQQLNAETSTTVASYSGSAKTVKDVLLRASSSFSEQRQPAADALADLCLEHYHDMAASTASSLYLLQKRVEGAIASLFPSIFLPLYSMVAFSEMPYHLAVQRAERQNKWLQRISTAAGVSVLLVAAAVGRTLLQRR